MRSSFWGTPAVISSHPGPGGDSRGRGEGGRGRAGGSALRVVPASRKRGAHASPHGGCRCRWAPYYGPALCWVQPVAARACWSPPAQGGRRGGGDPEEGPQRRTLSRWLQEEPSRRRCSLSQGSGAEGLGVALGSLAGMGDGSGVQDEGAQEGLWARGWGLWGHLPGHSHRVATMGRSQDSCDKRRGFGASEARLDPPRRLSRLAASCLPSATSSVSPPHPCC